MRSRVHLHLGYGSFGEYVERLFGYSPRTTFDKLRTAEALEGLPELDRALTHGELTWSAARELARVATAETEGDWLAAATGRTARDVERLVAGHERGDRPSDAARPHAIRHVLRFEVAAETLATFRHAMQELRRHSGEHLNDDTTLLLLARHVLGSGESLDDRTGADTGRASYQLALTLCEHCQRGFQDACGERLEVDPAIVEMARCDAQHIGRVGRTVVSSESGTPPAATAPAAIPSTTTRCAAPRRAPTPLDVSPRAVTPAVSPRAVTPAVTPRAVMPAATPRAVTSAATPRAVTPAATPRAVTSAVTEPHTTHPHVGVREAVALHRATQTIPPALRRHVLRRDQGRCVVPGCRHTIFVDLHHIEPRAEGGPHDIDNLVVLCTAHHRAVHHAQLTVTGWPSTSLRFEHADGTPYGHAPSPHTMVLLEQVFRGLRGLGFKEREARRALDAAAAELRAKEAAPAAQDLLRAALRRLGPRSSAR